MTRRIANDELACFGVEVAVRHVNGNALLAFSRQAVGEQSQIGFAMTLHAGQVVLQHSFGVNQQAAYEGALTIVNRATGDKFKRAAH